MNSSIQEIFKPKTSKNNSSKNPKFYNNEKNKCIAKGSIDSSPDVRRYFATSEHTPVKVLSLMVQTEQDKGILRLVLMNDRMPRKVVAKFVSDDTDERVEWFSEDQELIAHFQQEA